MSVPVFFSTIGIFFGTIVAVAAMRYFSAIRQAKARIAHDQAYRDIAAKAVADQADTAVALSDIQATLADLAVRLGGIERVLKEVE